MAWWHGAWLGRHAALRAVGPELLALLGAWCLGLGLAVLGDPSLCLGIPASPPPLARCLVCRCAGAPPEALLSLTHQLALRAADLRGHPMLFELASAAVEMLPLCLADPPPLPPGWGGSSTGILDWEEPSAAAGPGDSGRGSAADLAERAKQAEREGKAAQQAQRQQGGNDGQVRRQRAGAEPYHPPEGRGAAAAAQTAAGKRPAGGGGGRRAPQLDLASESRRLQEHQAQLERAPGHAAMRSVRSRLPAAGQKGEVVGLVESRRVVVISGATGCGKSTQVCAGRGCGGWVWVGGGEAVLPVVGGWGRGSDGCGWEWGER